MKMNISSSVLGAEHHHIVRLPRNRRSAEAIGQTVEGLVSYYLGINFCLQSPPIPYIYAIFPIEIKDNFY